MEHRYYPRMPISLDVDVFRRDQLLAHAQTRDISLGGMKLQHGQPVLNRNDVVVLRVWMNGEEQVMRGLVVHASQESAGVMLIDMSRDTTRNMFDFLREMDVPLRMSLGSFGDHPAKKSS
jgi:hypothetical protein